MPRNVTFNVLQKVTPRLDDERLNPDSHFAENDQDLFSQQLSKVRPKLSFFCVTMVACSLNSYLC